MTSITLNVTGARIRAEVSGPLTSGMVGIPVTIRYDDAWSGLTKNLVCRCGQWGPDRGETRTVLGIGETATVAHEVMKADMYLYLGIEGYSADGQLVMPTTWADCGKILHGANAGADPSASPKLSVWTQLQAQIEQIRQDSLTEEEVAAAVVAYLEDNPIEGSEFTQNVDYTDVSNKPKINGVELDGNKTAEELGIGQLTDEQISVAVDVYLDEHPEATTTVQDKSITEAKLSDGLKDKISPTYKKFKAVFLGDSNTAINTCKTKPWWQWVVELLGITNYVNYGQNGATLTTLGKSATPICERCKNMDADASMIFVMGGVNEFRADTQTSFGTISDTTPETIYGAVRYICRELQKKYPGTPIIFITPTNQKIWTHKDGHSMADLAKAIMDACHMEGVLCLDAQGSLGVNPAFDSSSAPDGLHLGDLGSELLGKWVVNQVRLHVPILSSSPNGGGSGGEVEPEEPDTEKTLSSISATYSGGSVPAGTSVYALSGIVVTAHYSDGTSANVTGYTLSGTVAEGSNTITVSYSGKTTTFTVTGVATLATYTVTNNLTNVNTNNATASVTDGKSYTATLTAVNGYKLDGVTVMMGGVEITSTAYASGVVSIASVTGNVVITANAILVEVVTLNIADYTRTDGFVAQDGTVQVSGPWTHTEKIPILPNKILTILMDARLNPIYYDADGNWISTNLVPLQIMQGTPTEVEVTTPENAAYLALNVYNDANVSSMWIKYEK